MSPGTFLQRAWLVAAALLALLAFRDLLVFEPIRAIPEPVERLLFEPADTTPALIVALSLWLVYRRRERWQRLPDGAGPLWLTVPLLATGAALLIWAKLTGAHDLLALSLLAAGLGLASLRKGAAGVRLLLLPAGFLLFAVPLPPALSNRLIFQFQLWTAEITGRLLFLFGMPARVAGDSIQRSDYTFSVIEGCSGLRSVLTLSMLAVLMVDLFRRRRLHAVIVVLAAPFVAFGLNAVRAVALIVNPHSSLASVHVAQGVAILLCGLLVLYALDGVLARLISPSGGGGAPPAGPPAAPARPGAALAALVVLAGLSLGVKPWERVDSVPLGLSNRYVRELGDWTASPLETDRLFLGSVSFRENLSVRYQQDGEAVDLFLGIGDRAQRFSSAQSPKTELPGSGWVVEERGTASFGTREIDALVERSAANRRLLVYHWMEGAAGPGREALRSLAAIDATPWSQARDPLVVRVSTEIAGPSVEDRRRAEARLKRFLSSFRVDLERLIRDMDVFSKPSRRKGFS
jgi:EpsI family protein